MIPQIRMFSNHIRKLMYVSYIERDIDVQKISLKNHFKIHFFRNTNNFAMSYTSLDREKIRLFFEELYKSIHHIVLEISIDY